MPAAQAHVQLNFLQLLGAIPLDGEPVIEVALEQAVQERKFRRFGRNDHFP